MNFNNNLIQLRKREQLSQEALAEKVGVTRQTIYKWETSATYPEMDKLIDLAKVLNVSVDFLINGDIEEEEEEIIPKETIVKKIKSYANCLAIAISSILLGVALIVALSEIKEGIGLVSGVSVLFAAVLAIIAIAMRMESYKQVNNLTVSFTKKEKAQAYNNLILKIVIGFAFIFISIIQLLAVDAWFEKYDPANNDVATDVAVGIMLVLIGFSTYFFITGGMVYSLYDNPGELLKSNRESTKEYYKKEKETLNEKLCAVIMILSTIAFFLFGFLLDAWRICWLSFVVGGLLCAIVGIFFGDSPKEEKNIEE